MSKAVAVDVYDKDGNLTKVEFSDGAGTHIADVVWDPSEEQTSENRIEFRKWAYRMIEQKGYAVPK
jgi:hypothetical protein